MAAFQKYAGEFERFGHQLAALAVDAAPRAKKLQRDLELSFPILCDTQRENVRRWELYNAKERGGIAVPATVVLGRDGRVILFAREGVARRLAAREVLDFVASGGTVPVKHGFWPRLRFWWRAFLH